MRLGLSTAAFYGRYETEEAAAQIAELPLECCEAFLQTPSEYTRDFARLTREKLGRVACTSVHPMGIQFENAMFSRSRRQKGDAFDLFRRVLDAGQELGARVYVYHGRSSAQLAPLPWNLEANLETLCAMAEEAGARGMAVGWENVFWCQLTCPERVREAARAYDGVCFTLDIKQAMRAGADPCEMARAMGRRLINVHLCDWDEAGKLCLPGEGSVDFAALFAQLAEIGYEGPVVLEPYLALIKSREALERSLAHLRRCAEEGAARAGVNEAPRDANEPPAGELAD